jgi:hypothetical protein
LTSFELRVGICALELACVTGVAFVADERCARGSREQSKPPVTAAQEAYPGGILRMTETPAALP